MWQHNSPAAFDVLLSTAPKVSETYIAGKVVVFYCQQANGLSTRVELAP
ncbi:MAG: hypothetical protein ACJ701_08360 [Nitrososphaera sp.]